MSLVNSEINLILTQSENCILKSGAAANQLPTFEITDKKLYVPVVTLPTNNNAKLQIEQAKTTTKKKQYLYYVTDPRFQK